MAAIRIEALKDETSGQVFAAVYKGDDQTPALKSQASFDSEADLADQVLGVLRDNFPDHFPFVDDPTIGV
jgi:hypothetical protein